MKRSRKSPTARMMLVMAMLISFVGSAPGQAANMTPGDKQVLRSPALHIAYWGNQWDQNLSWGGVTLSRYQSYIENFLHLVTDSGLNNYWNSTLEYGALAPPTINGVWYTREAVPSQVSESDVITEVRSVEHAAGNYKGGSNYRSDGNSIYMIILPPLTLSATANSNGWCAYHNMADETSYAAKTTYIVLPYIARDTPGCWSNFNSQDSFGHGNLDGVSKAIAHEIGETITNPFGTSWYEPIPPKGQNENGDKCNGNRANIGVDSRAYYAVQDLWSNAAAGCVYGVGGASLTAPGFAGFPDTQVNRVSARGAITYRNIGQQDLSLSGLRYFISGAGSTAFYVDTSSCKPGSVLHPGEGCTLYPRFSPRQRGASGATLTFKTSKQTLTTTLSGYAPSAFEVLKVDMSNFPQTTIGSSYGSLVHVKNVSANYVQLAQSSLTGADAADYSILRDYYSCPLWLAPNGDCYELINFQPSLRGARSAAYNIAVFTQTDGGTYYDTYTSSMYGTGGGSSYSLSDAELQNANLNAGVTDNFSQLQATLTITANGEQPLAINYISIDGAFGITQSCPGFLAVGQSCTVHLVGFPSQLGQVSGTLTISTDATDSIRTVQVSGTAVIPYAISSASTVDFGRVPANIPASRTVRITALEGVPFQISSVSLGGAAQFSQTNDCPSSFGGTCLITVNLDTSALGTFDGTLTVATTASNGTITIPIKAVVEAEPTALTATPAVLVLAGGTTASAFTLSATLTGPGGISLPGQTIQFSAGSTNVCSATTNAQGVATCSTLTQPAGAAAIVLARGYTARFPGTATMTTSSARAPLANINGKTI